MASSLITSWQIGGETMETVTDFIFLGSKITVNGDCMHEIKKKKLLLRRKTMTNLNSILKRKDLQKQTQNNQENANRTICINNYLKCKWIKCTNQKTWTDWVAGNMRMYVCIPLTRHST